MYDVVLQVATVELLSLYVECVEWRKTGMQFIPFFRGMRRLIDLATCDWRLVASRGS